MNTGPIRVQICLAAHAWLPKIFVRLRMPARKQNSSQKNYMPRHPYDGRAKFRLLMRSTG